MLHAVTQKLFEENCGALKQQHRKHGIFWFHTFSMNLKFKGKTNRSICDIYKSNLQLVYDFWANTHFYKFYTDLNK